MSGRPKSTPRPASPKAAPAAPAVSGPDELGPLETWEDEALFAAVAAGSEAHFNVLYERYFQRIYAFVYLRIRNHADAEEITQETFTVVFRAAEAWGGRASPLAWVYGIAKNTVSNHLRKLRTGRERLEQAGPAALVTTSPAWSYTPEQQLDLDRCAARLDERLASVAEWQAEAFVLRHAENRSIPEISRRMGRSSDAVRSGLYRVKKLLMEVGVAGSTQDRTP